jgi:hypothetical protein
MCGYSPSIVLTTIKNQTIMSLEFKVYERSADTLESIGTIATLAGAGASVAFINSNLSNPNKRVAVVAMRKDGKSTTVSCGKDLSELVRNHITSGVKKSALLGKLAQMPIYEVAFKNAKGEPTGEVGYFIGREGGALEFATISAATKEAVSLEELVAF